MIIDDRMNELVRKHSAFNSMDDLLSAKGDYRPSLHTSNRNWRNAERKQLKRIADAYDYVQQARGDVRRAFRY